MSFLLPASPAVKEFSARLITAGGVQSTATGSDEFYIDRPGDRWQVDFTMRPMTYDQSADWSDLEEFAASVAMRLPQPGLDTGAPGVPRVDGSGQTGSTLKLKGMTPSYAIRRRQWIPVTSAGRIFAYRARADAIVGANGKVAVPIRPMLRYPHLDNDFVDIGDPKIEGQMSISDDAWAVSATDRHVYLSFSIRERG